MESLQVRLCLPRALSFVDGRQGSRLSEKGGGSSRRPGDVSLATKIAWPNTMWFFFSYGNMLWNLSTSCATGSARDLKANHCCHLRNLSWYAAADLGGKDYRLNGYHVTKPGHTEHLRCTKKKLREIFFSSEGRVLQSFPPFKSTDFMKRVKELWITLYIINPLAPELFF